MLLFIIYKLNKFNQMLYSLFFSLYYYCLLHVFIFSFYFVWLLNLFYYTCYFSFEKCIISNNKKKEKADHFLNKMKPEWMKKNIVWIIIEIWKWVFESFYESVLLIFKHEISFSFSIFFWFYFVESLNHWVQFARCYFKLKTKQNIIFILDD